MLWALLLEVEGVELVDFIEENFIFFLYQCFPTLTTKIHYKDYLQKQIVYVQSEPRTCPLRP